MYLIKFRSYSHGAVFCSLWGARFAEDTKNGETCNAGKCSVAFAHPTGRSTSTEQFESL